MSKFLFPEDALQLGLEHVDIERQLMLTAEAIKCAEVLARDPLWRRA